MKIIFDEDNKLPLTYKYIEVYGAKKIKSLKPRVKPLTISKIQSDFRAPSAPFKKLVRLL